MDVAYVPIGTEYIVIRKFTSTVTVLKLTVNKLGDKNKDENNDG